jgi:UDP-3-O-[3-hydroxymyristoyl] glucosamine N-acyltransferase LpxD
LILLGGSRVSVFHFEIGSQELLKAGRYGKVVGDSVNLTTVASIGNPADHALMFLREWRESKRKSLHTTGSLIVVPDIAELPWPDLADGNQILFVQNPRLEFARLLQFIVRSREQSIRYRYREFPGGTSIEESSSIGSETIIGRVVTIEHNVRIGAHCTIGAGVRLLSGTTIGDSCTVRENTVIGGQGFGFERDGEGRVVRLPHVGGVAIGSRVEVGSLVTICAGAIDPTVIEDDVAIDDHVHVAHNCHIGQQVTVTACAELSGSVRVGARSWIAPNASIMNGVELGEDCLVGLGAVVIMNCKAGDVLIGNPARVIRNKRVETE